MFRLQWAASNLNEFPSGGGAGLRVSEVRGRRFAGIREGGKMLAGRRRRWRRTGPELARETRCADWIPAAVSPGVRLAGRRPAQVRLPGRLILSGWPEVDSGDVARRPASSSCVSTCAGQSCLSGVSCLRCPGCRSCSSALSQLPRPGGCADCSRRFLLAPRNLFAADSPASPLHRELVRREADARRRRPNISI